VRSLCLTILLAATTAWAGPGVELRHLAQHTNTSEVRDVALTRERAWAATAGGLVVHSRRDGRFLFKLTAADGLPGNSLRVVEVVGKGRLFVGGDFGAAVLHGADKLEKGAKARISSLKELGNKDTYSPVAALLRASSGTETFHILLAMQKPLLRVESTRRGRMQITKKIGKARWWQCAAVSAEHIALGDLTGLVAVYPLPAVAGEADWEPAREIYLDGPVLSLARAGDAFVAASGEGLYRIEKQRVRQIFVHRKDGRAAPVPATVVAPRDENSVLVGTADGLVLALLGASLRPKAPRLEGRITALEYDRPGLKLWIGVDRLGLHLGVSNSPAKPEALRPAGEICGNHVTHLTRHRRRLVAGTFDRGACVLTKKGWKPLELPSPMVLGLASDGYYLYVANSGGLSRFGPRFEPRPIGEREPKALQWYAGSSTTAAVRVRPGVVGVASRFGVMRIFRKRSGRVWVRYTNHEDGAPFKMTGLASAAGCVFVASESEGVKRMGFGRREPWHLQDPRELPENWVTSLSVIGADELWVATCQQGAVHVKRNGSTHVRRFGTAQGLRDMRLTAVAANRRGAFLGSLNGLAWASADQERVVGFGLAHGLPDPRSSALYLNGRRLWVSTESGLAMFAVKYE